MSKIIEVKRHFSLVEMSQSDPEVQEWLGQSYRGIGPYFKNKAVATGLSFEEEKLLLPHLFHVEATDKDFRKHVDNFYHNMVTSVPKNGLKLQIGLQDPTQPLSETNLPLNIKDYITYRHIRGHRDVAHNEAEAKREFGKRYYILDPESASQTAISLNSLEDTCYSLYSQYKDDLIKTDQILTMLGVNIRQLNAEDKVLKLKSFVVKDQKLTEVEQRESFERFKKVATDKDLEYKYLIQELIGAQYLKRVGTNIVIHESGEKIGDNMDDAVLFLKNPKHSRDLNMMRAIYLEKVKKSEAYLPKEAKDSKKPTKQEETE